MLLKENFDFDVIRENLYCTVNGVRIQSDKDMILRADNCKPLGVVGKGYNIITHTDIINSANNALSDLEIETKQSTTLTKDGARMYHTIDFPTETIEPVVGDIVSMQAIVKNSYDGSLKGGFEVGGMRLVCSNGMKTFDRAFFMLQKHSALFDLDDITENFKKAITMFHMEVNGFFKVLQGTPIEQMAGLSMIKTLIEKKLIPEKYGNAAGQIWMYPNEVNDIIADTGGPQNVILSSEMDKARNLWTWYNALTAVISHCIKSIERQQSIHMAVQQTLKNKLK